MSWRYTIGELAAAIGAQAPAAIAGTPFERVSTDTRTLEAGQVFFALKGEQFDGAQFVGAALERGAAAAVTAGGAAGGGGRVLVVADALAALQRFAQWHRARLGMPVFAVTGSCGKTTVKNMTAAVLGTKYRVAKTQGNLNNEIGCPLTLLEMDGATEFGVVEMGANHAGEIARMCALARPSESAITMVGPAHLEGFGSVAQVAAAKAEIVHGLGSGGVFYVNVDNAWTREIGAAYAGPKVLWGSHGDVVLEGCAFADDGEMLIDVAPVGRLRLPLPIRAHAANVVLAVAVGLRHGAAEFEGPLRAACREAVRFRIERLGPLEVIDDSYNANPSSMAAALEALGSRPGGGARYAALGEMLELGEYGPLLHREIGELAARHGVQALFARGQHARDMIEGARAAGLARAEAHEDHAAMARAIHETARAGDVLLVKGSRGLRMERVIHALRALYGEAAAPEAGH